MHTVFEGEKDEMTDFEQALQQALQLPAHKGRAGWLLQAMTVSPDAHEVDVPWLLQLEIAWCQSLTNIRVDEQLMLTHTPLASAGPPAVTTLEMTVTCRGLYAAPTPVIQLPQTRPPICGWSIPS